MKKLFLLAIAALTVCGVACTSEKGGGSEEPQGPFAIYYASLTHNSVAITVDPADATATYYFNVAQKAAVDKFASTDELATYLIPQLQALAAEYSLTLADLLSTGMDGYNFEGLYPETEYYAYAFGVSADGVLTSSVVLKPFTTLARPSSDDVPALDYFTYGYYENFGDAYDTNAANWYIDIYSESAPEAFILEVQTALDATSFEGTYQFAGTGAVGTAVVGSLVDGYLYGSYWAEFNAQNQIVGARLMQSGTAVIAKDGSNYVITVEGEAQDLVSGGVDVLKISYNAALEEYVDEETGTSVAKFNIHSRKAKKFEVSKIQTLKPIVRK